MTDPTGATDVAQVHEATHTQHPRRPGEISFALLMLLFSVTAVWLSYQISGFQSWSSAGAVPLGTSVFMTLSAAVILLDTLKKKPVPSNPGDPLWHRFYEIVFPLRHILFTAIIIGYMLVLERFGFLLSSFLFLMLSSALMGERRYARMTMTNVLILALVYVVFQTVFSVILPDGPVEKLLGSLLGGLR